MNHKILLIEDDQVVANVYRNKLLVEGFQVEIAEDGEAGLNLVHGFRPDVVLLDLMLPKLPGVEIIRKLRLEPDFRSLPILVFTNTYLTGIVQEAWKAGATKCMAKADCTPSQMVAALRSLLPGNGADKTQPTPAAPAAKTRLNAKSLPPEPHAASRVDTDADQEFQAQLRDSFVAGLPSILAALRMLLQGLIKAEHESLRLQQLQLLYEKARSITGNASIVGLGQIARMSDALEALLKELHDKPATINTSTLRTVASAIDFLGILFEPKNMSKAPQSIDAKVLVVDDESIARRALVYALDKAKLRSVSIDDPVRALGTLSQDKFDLVLLDVHMPQMNGFELCSKLRTLPNYKMVPVVFVTSLNDLESRANSSVSGGNDFIAKPFLFIELAVKALVHVMRSQVEMAHPLPVPE